MKRADFWCCILAAVLAISFGGQAHGQPIKVEIEKNETLPLSPRDSQGHIILQSAFLGTWNVASLRLRGRDPAVEKRFNLSMNNVLTIAGKPGAYLLGSNTGFMSPVQIDSVHGEYAKLRSEQKDTTEFNERVRVKNQLLDIHLMPGNRMFEGTFVFDIIFATGERVQVEYGVRGVK